MSAAGLNQMSDMSDISISAAGAAAGLNQMSDMSDISISPGELGDTELASLCEGFGIDAAGPIEKLKVDAVSDLGCALRLVVRAGLGFLALRAQLGHGEYLDALAALNVSRQRAHEATRLATLYGQLPEDQRGRLLAAPKTKALMLASLDNSELEQLEEQGGVDSLLALPKTALVSEIAKIKKQRDSAVRAAEDLENHLKLARRAALPQGSAPAWLRPAKLEVGVLSEGVSECLDGLERMGQELVLNGGDAVSQRQLAGTMYFSLAELYVRLHQLLSNVAAEHGEALQGATAHFDCALDPDQIAELAAQRRQVLNAMQLRRAELLGPAAATPAEQPRKRGRPAGSTTKKTR